MAKIILTQSWLSPKLLLRKIFRSEWCLSRNFSFGRGLLAHIILLGPSIIINVKSFLDIAIRILIINSFLWSKLPWFHIALLWDIEAFGKIRSIHLDHAWSLISRICCVGGWRIRSYLSFGLHLCVDLEGIRRKQGLI